MTEKCVIFTGGVPEPYMPEGVDTEGAFVVAADSGYRCCKALGFEPQLVIGDFDSLGGVPECIEYRRFPKEKDDTDLMLAVRAALEQGCRDITIIGAMGGRFDHTFANVQTLAFITGQGARGRIAGVNEDIELLIPGSYRFPAKEGRSFSLFAYSPEVRGLSIVGAEYPLENGTVTNSFPIGISNEITSDTAEVSFTEGLLLVVRSAL